MGHERKALEADLELEIWGQPSVLWAEEEEIIMTMIETIAAGRMGVHVNGIVIHPASKF